MAVNEKYSSFRLETTEEPYQHAALPRGEFRIALLQPSSDENAPISFQLTTSDSYSGEYEAVSYTWANPDVVYEKILLVEDEYIFQYKIPKNLHDGLKKFRLKDAVRALWADAMCIDMSNLGERAEQIRMMLEIFRRASRVCVWLCDETEVGMVATDFIAQLAEVADVDDFVRNLNFVKQWEAVTWLLYRPWFHRIWVVPEISIARAATVYCGSSFFDWTDLKNCINIFRYTWEVAADRSIIPVPSATRLIDVVDAIFRRNQFGEALEPLLSLDDLVMKLSYMRSSDPRDRIYALLTLASDTGYWNQKANERNFSPPNSPLEVQPQPTFLNAFEPSQMPDIPDPPENNFPIDYNRSFVDVFNDFIKFTVQKSGSLDILFQPWAPIGNWPAWICQADQLPYRLEENDAPNTIRINGQPFVGSPGEPRPYNASRGFSTQSGWEIRDNNMRVMGVVVDVIKSVAPPAWYGVMPPEWLSLGEVSQHHAADSFWRTLIGDRGPGGRKCPPYYALAFDTLNIKQSGKTGINFAQAAEDHSESIKGEYCRRVEEVIWNRELALLSHGRLGLVPASAREGDYICILFGASVPAVLRRSTDNEDAFQLVGECYVHGIMDGEALSINDGVPEAKWFEITANSPTRYPLDAAPIPKEESLSYILSPVPLQSKTRYKEQTMQLDINACQYRLYWTCCCNYKGFCIHTEFQPGMVENLAERMRASGFEVSLELLGVENPITDAIKIFALYIAIYFNNLLAEFRSALLEGTRSKVDVTDGSEADSMTKVLNTSQDTVVGEEIETMVEPTTVNSKIEKGEISMDKPSPRIGTLQLTPGTPSQGTPPSAAQQSTAQKSALQYPPPSYGSPSNSGATTGAKVPLKQLPTLDVLTGAGDSTATTPPTRTDKKYLLLCMHDTNYLVTRDDIEVSTLKYDQRVFQKIKTCYNARKPSRFQELKAWLGIQRPLKISFVKFDLLEGTEVCNLQAPKLPRPRVTFYDFKPREHPLPPFDNGPMMHRYENPGHCRSSTRIFEQIPKRKDRPPVPGTSPDMRTGWGLYMIDGPDPGRLLKFGVAVYAIAFLASFIFGLVWSLVSPDRSVGDAYTTASYIWTAVVGATALLVFL